MFQCLPQLPAGQSDSHQVVIERQRRITVLGPDLPSVQAGADSTAVDQGGVGSGRGPHDVGDQVAQVGLPGAHLLAVQVHLGFAHDLIQAGIHLPGILAH